MQVDYTHVQHLKCWDFNPAQVRINVYQLTATYYLLVPIGLAAF